jgi:RNA polymerase sigma-70 factor (ECF subfamily)
MGPRNGGRMKDEVAGYETVRRRTSPSDVGTRVGFVKGGREVMVVLPFTSKRALVDRQSFDRAYIERLRAGDAETERHFYAYFSELIMIKARARRSVEADDIRQETLLRVLRTLRAPGGLRDPGALGAFVNSVCTNVLRESARSLTRHEAPPEDREAIPDAVTPGPESQLMTSERQEAVRRVLESLPQRDRELLRAIYLDERDKVRICEELGVNRDYLRVLLHRAKNLFRTLYREREETPPPASVDRKAGGTAVW